MERRKRQQNDGKEVLDEKQRFVIEAVRGRNKKKEEHFVIKQSFFYSFE